MKYELCFDNCLDLPSLTQIQGEQNCIHQYMGYVILESMIWFDLIWIDIPNLTENNIHYGNRSYDFTAELQSTSNYSFSFSRLRCWWIERLCYSSFKIQSSWRWDAIKRSLFHSTQSIHWWYSYWYPTSRYLWIWRISRWKTNPFIIAYSKTTPSNLYTFQTFQTINHKFTNILKTIISNSNRFELIE